MKRAVIILGVLILALAIYLALTKDTSRDKPISVAYAALSTFRWRFQEGALNADGLPGTRISLDATYGNGKVISKEIGEVGSSCNEIPASPEDQDMVQGTAKIQCYGAGLGQLFKIVKSEGSYAVKRKTFEEALPDSIPLPSEYETVTVFPSES